MIVSGRGWNYVGVAFVIVNCTVKHAVKHIENTENDTENKYRIAGNFWGTKISWLSIIESVRGKYFRGCL